MSTQIFITSISATDPMGDRSERTFATARKGQKRTPEQRQRMSEGRRKAKEKRNEQQN